MHYVAFLRGINVHGRTVLMKDLQKAFEVLGFTDVRTLIASGNVVFISLESKEETLRHRIEEKLEKICGFPILVILRRREEIQKLVKSNPFGSARQDHNEGTEVASSSRNDGLKPRLQITLFSDNIASLDPIKKAGFEIHVIGNRELASVVYPGGKTTDMMTYIDKTFGKNSTTRNWNTILKLVE